MNVAILGAGQIAEKMAKAVTMLGGSITAYAVAARDIDRAEAFRARWGFCKAYGSYEQMLSDPEVDLVYIATPHSHHHIHARLCIEHGKHVLVEKPFTANAALAREIFALAREKGVLITEAMWTRYMPSRALIDETIASGIIGQPRMIVADLSYPMQSKGRIADPALAGGALLDVGVYPLHFASMVFGNEITKITGTCTYQSTGVDAQDSITLHYPDGRMAVLTSSMEIASHRLGIIYGTRGYIHCTNVNNVESIEVYNMEHQLVRTVPIPQQINGYEYEVLACQRAIAQGWLECPEMPHSETLLITEWMDQLRADWGIRYPFE